MGLLAEVRRLLRLAGPLVVSHLATVGMNTVDTLMVAPLGAVPLAAMAAAVAIHFVTIMVAIGVVLGMTPLVSQAEGAGDRPEARRVLVQGLWLALFLGVPTVAISVVGEPMARILGQEPAVAAAGGDYLLGLAPGIPPLLLFMACRQFVEGLGMTKPTMAFLLVAFALNIPANAVLIYGIDGWVAGYGVAGSAWATSLVRAALLVMMVSYLIRHPALHPLRGVRISIDLPRIRRIARVGAPIGGQIGLEVGLFSAAALMMGWFGATALAAHQVTINLASTTFMVALGASLAGTIRVGQHVGAGRSAGTRLAALSTYIVAVGFMALCALAFLLLPEPLVRLYTADPEIIRTAAGLLLLAAAFQVFDGAQVAGMCVLRGAADTRVPMLIAAVAYWAVGAPTAYLLGFHTRLGPAGIWLGLTAALAMAAVLLVVRVRRTLWRGPVAALPLPTPAPAPVLPPSA